MLEDPDSYTVLVSGDGPDRRTLDATAQAALREYATRPKIDMAAIVQRFYSELRDKEQEAKRASGRKSRANKRAREETAHADRKGEKAKQAESDSDFDSDSESEAEAEAAPLLVSLGHMVVALTRANVDISSITRLKTRVERELAIAELYNSRFV